MQSDPVAAVVAWLDQQPATSVWTTTISVFEIQYGLHRLPGGSRTVLEDAFRSVVHQELRGRVLSFDVQAALAAGAVSATLEAAGRKVEIRDVQIGGIAQSRKAAVATRNVKHFEHACDVVNPWESASTT